MKSFKLELRVYEHSARRFMVCLEQLREEYIVHHWIPPSSEQDYYSRVFPKYTISDNSLEIYLACTGYGSSVSCQILINDVKPNKSNTLVADYTQSKPAFKSITIK